MGKWSTDIYVRKWNDCLGVCEWCNKPINGRGVLHHIINRANFGKDTYDNAELRHKECEKYAHDHFKYGNRSNEMNTAHKPKKVNPKRFNPKKVIFREPKNPLPVLQDFNLTPFPEPIEYCKPENKELISILGSGVSLTIGNAIVTFRQNGTSYQINVDPVA